MAGLFMNASASTSIAVPASIDWVSLSKTLAIEVVFIGASASALFFHGGQDAITLAFATGGTLGVLRIGDQIASAVNTRTYANSPVAQKAGILPQANTAALISTTEGSIQNAGVATP